MSLEKVSGGVILVTLEVNTAGLDEKYFGDWVNLSSEIQFRATEDGNKPLDQRQCSPLFGRLIDAIMYASKKGWSTKIIDITVSPIKFK